MSRTWNFPETVSRSEKKRAFPRAGSLKPVRIPREKKAINQRRWLGWLLLALVWGGVGLRLVYPADLHGGYTGILALATTAIDLVLITPAWFLLMAFGLPMEDLWAFSGTAVWVLGISILIYVFLIRKRSPGGSAKKPETDQGKIGEHFGMLMLLLPICTSALMWFWIENMPAIQGPDKKLNLLVWVTIMGGALLVWLEARQLKIGNRNGPGEPGPVAWFFFVVMLPFIAFPVYLSRRHRYGLNNYFWSGIMVAVVFFGSYSIIDQTISLHVLGAVAGN